MREKPASRSQSSIAGRFDQSPKVAYASSVVIWRATASAISARPWPTWAYQRLDEPSM